MKHCRGQIYVEQAYDAYLAFRFLKQISKHVIKSNLTSFELIETLTKSFSKWKLEGKLFLKPTKEITLKDFLVCF